MLFKLLDADDDNFLKLERMTVILDDRISLLNSVYETRSELLGHKNLSMDKLPPGTHQGCRSPAPDGLCIKQESENQRTNKVSGFFSTGVCLNLGIRAVGTSLDDNSRGFKIVQ